MFSVLIVLGGSGIENLFSRGSKSRDAFCDPRLLERAGIVECCFDLEVAEIGTGKACCYFQFVGVRRGFSDPSLIIEANRLDDECVSFPFPGRVTGPRKFKILGMRTSIQINLAISRD